MSGGIIGLVPVRSLRAGKTRLAGVLSPEQRESLTRRMVSGVLRSARESNSVETVIVVSPDGAALRSTETNPGVIPLHQPITDPGLISGLNLGRRHAESMGASGLLILFGDLPLLDSHDIRNLVRRAVPVVIAPDRHGAGTNAMFLRLSAIAPDEHFEFQFGEGSYRRHVAEAHRLGLDVATSVGRGTAFDLDTPEDLHTLLNDPEWADHDLALNIAAVAPLEQAS